MCPPWFCCELVIHSPLDRFDGQVPQRVAKCVLWWFRVHSVLSPVCAVLNATIQEHDQWSMGRGKGEGAAFRRVERGRRCKVNASERLQLLGDLGAPVFHQRSNSF